MMIHAAVILQGCVMAMFYRPRSKKKVVDTGVEMKQTSIGPNPVSADIDTHKRKTRTICLENVQIIQEGRTLMKQKSFKYFLIGVICSTYAITVMYQHTPSRAVYKGSNSLEAGFILSAMGVTSLTGRLCTSLLAAFKCTNRMLFLAVDTLIGAIVLAASCLASGFYDITFASGIYGLFLGR